MKSGVAAKIRAAWLEQGCFNLSGLTEEERFTYSLRDRLRRLTGKSLSIALWPGAGNFKHTTWWHEKAVPATSVASFFATVNGRRGCGLFGGVRVEKGLEDEKAAVGRRDDLMKDVRAWDWSNFLKRMGELPRILKKAQAALGGQTLYLWLEFHHQPRGKDFRDEENRYYRLRNGIVYQQGGEKASEWDEVVEFIKRDRAGLWGDISIVRPFGVADWHDHDLLQVFEALSPVYRLWRGY